MYTEQELNKEFIRQQLLDDPAELDKLIQEMPDYRRTITLATLDGDKHWPQVIEAFANLCKALSSEWSHSAGYNQEGHGIYIVMDSNRVVRDKTYSELIETVAQSIADQRRAQNLTEQNAHSQVEALAALVEQATE